MRIEWDERKALANLEKHGVSLEEGATVLLDLLAATLPDDASGEERWVTLGQSATGKTLVVVYTDHEDRSGDTPEQVLELFQRGK